MKYRRDCWFYVRRKHNGWQDPFHQFVFKEIGIPKSYSIAWEEIETGMQAAINESAHTHSTTTVTLPFTE